MESEGGPVVLRGGPDLRSEVLRLVAKRDRKLGEEFLKALDEAAEKERSEAATDQRNNPGNRLGGSQRLQLARRLVEDGEVERALEFATPALNSVNPDSIFFLSALREKNAQLADGAFTNLLALRRTRSKFRRQHSFGFVVVSVHAISLRDLREGGRI